MLDELLGGTTAPLEETQPDADGGRAGKKGPATESASRDIKRKRPGGRKPGKYRAELKRCLQFYDQMAGKSLAEARLFELRDYARRWLVKRKVMKIPQRTALETAIKKVRDKILDAKRG